MTSVRSANKHQSQLLATPESSTKRNSVRSANKQQSQISFISTSKARIKHTVSVTIHRKRQITPVPVGEHPAHSQAQEVPLLICHGVICLLPFLWDKFMKKAFLNLVTIQSFSFQILRLYVICECIRRFFTFKTPVTFFIESYRF